MSASETKPTLLEKYPELESAWKNDVSGSYRTLLREYEQHSRYQSVRPIAWRKPEAFVRADAALSELGATASITRLLATMANEQSYSPQEKNSNSEQYTAFALRFARVESMLTQAQIATETLAAVGEMRWLQHNVKGDFSRMPQSWRARYTNTPRLLSDHGLNEMKRILANQAEVVQLQKTVETMLAQTNEALNDVQRFMCAEGPLYGFTWPEARALAEHDYKICTETLLPHMHDQIMAVRLEIPTLNRYATSDLSLKIIGATGDTDLNVSPLVRRFRQPRAEDNNDRPDPNNVTDISDALRIRAERDKSK